MVAHANPCDATKLRRLLDDRLDDDEQAELARHLEACELCRRALERLAAESRLWVDARRLAGEAPPTCGLEREHDAGEPDDTLGFLEPSDDPAVLGTLSPYEVTDVIGRGGFGVVLKAFDRPLNRFVAIKVLAPELATSATARRRFAREARAAAAIGHDHIVAIHAVDATPSGLPYIVMQHVSGRSLQERLDKAGPPEPREVVRIGMQAASGLAAAHAVGLVHRDIKPANILLENGVERVKLTDFGLARAADDASLTQSGVVAGTPQYMAPEQARGEPVDARSDLFSLGSVLYAICTGRPPFRAETTMAVLRRVCDDTPRPIREINPEVPEWLAAIVEKLQAKDPADRFQSAAEVSALFSRCLAYLEKPGKQPPFVPDRPQPPRRPSRRWLVPAAALLVAVAGLGASEASGVTKLADFVTTVLRIKHADGTVVLEIDDPEITVRVDGSDVVVKGAGLQELRLSPGRHHIETAKGALKKTDLVTVTRGGKQAFKATFEPSPADATASAADRGEANVLLLRARIAELEGRLRGQPSALKDVATQADAREAALAESLKRLEALSRLVRDANDPALISARNTLKQLEDELARNSTSRTPRPAGTDPPRLGVLDTMPPRSDARRWDVQVYRALPEIGTRLGARRWNGMTLPTAVLAVALSPDGRTFALGCFDGSVRIHDLITGQLKSTAKFHTAPVRTVAFSPDGKLLAFAGDADRDSSGRMTEVIKIQLKSLEEYQRELAAQVGEKEKQLLALAGKSYADFQQLIEAMAQAESPLASARSKLTMDEYRRLRDELFRTTMALSEAKALLEQCQKEANDAAGRGGAFKSPAELEAAEAQIARKVELALRDDPELARANEIFERASRSYEDASRLTRSPNDPAVVKARRTVEDAADRRQKLRERRSRDYFEQFQEELEGKGNVNTLAKAINEARASVRSLEVKQETYKRMLRDTEVINKQEANDQIRMGLVREELASIKEMKDIVDKRLEELKFETKTTEPSDIVFWDVASGRVVRTLKGHTATVWSVAFSPDGKTLASGSADKTARLWDVETGQTRKVLEGHQGAVRSVAFAPTGNTVGMTGSNVNGPTLATASDDGTIKFWHNAPGQEHDGKLWSTHHATSLGVSCVVFSPDCRTLAISPKASTTEIRPDEVILLDLSTWKERGRLKGHRAGILAVAFSPDGKTIATGGGGPTGAGDVFLWDAGSLKEKARFTDLPGRVESLAFTPDGRSVVGGLSAGDQRGEVRVWGLDRPPAPKVKARMEGLKGNRIWSLSFSPDGRSLAITGGVPQPDVPGYSDDKGFLGLWNVARGLMADPLAGSRYVRSAAFSPDGKLLATAEIDGTAKVRDADTGKLWTALKGHTEGVNGVAFSPDGKLLATAGLDGQVLLWEASTGPAALIRPFVGHESKVFGVAFSPDGKTFATGGLDHTARLWDAATGQARAVLQGHDDAVEAVAFSPDGKLLATASWDRTVKLWDVATGRALATLSGHTVCALGVAFSPDGKLLATGGGTWAAEDSGPGKGELKLWDVAARAEVASLDGHSDRVFAVAFSPDGRTLASAGWEGVVLLWDLNARLPAPAPEPKK
jgi:WD40 repeat protein/serine/threonine protein kinase